MNNVKQELSAKVETINTIMRFIDSAKKDTTLTVDDIERYLKSMRESYKTAFETLSRLPGN
jgi:t-SNARE complex subunit (syntaxin)